MSIQFNDTTNYKGLVQLYEKMLGFTRGYVSGDTDRLKEFTAEANIAWDDFMTLAIPASGTWQFDDTSTYESDGTTLRGYPIIKTNLVSGQRDYTFSADGQGNLILDIYKVAVLPTSTSTFYMEIDPMDEFEGYSDIVTERTTTGVPTRYGKLSNGIFLNIPTNYNATNGLKIFINREASYFKYDDTTKMPGAPGILHLYFALKPALVYAQRNNLSVAGGRLRNGAFTGMLSDVMNFEKRITDYFEEREKDNRKIMTSKIINFR